MLKRNRERDDDSRNVIAVAALAMGDDDYTTSLSVRRRSPAELLLFIARLEKNDPDLVAVDPGKLAAAIGEAGRRQQQEKFLQVQTLDRSLDGELGAGLGDIFHDA